MTEHDTYLKRCLDALLSIPCGNCHLYPNGICPCACHAFPLDRGVCAGNRLRELVKEGAKA